jgi:hypothetical protein
MNDKKVQFFPFHAVNDFMRADFRQEVVRSTLAALPTLPEEFHGPIERQTKKLVQVPGFRNSAKAPVNVRIKPTADAFEKSPQLVAAILYAWSAVHSELRQQVYDLLIARKWEVLPPDADRTKLPGFLVKWPKGEDFEALNTAFKEMYPDSQANSDDVSLMVVWVSTRLPYQTEGEEAEENEEQEQA